MMKMKTSKEVLSSVLKTTQMGQVGIRSLLNMPLKPELKAALRAQLAEYDGIEHEVLQLSRDRQWQLKELSPGTKAMAQMMSRSRLMFGDASSKAAAMMIQGNTRGVIKGLKNLHRYDHSDRQVTQLEEKLLKTEQDNIDAMQGFV